MTPRMSRRRLMQSTGAAAALAGTGFTVPAVSAQDIELLYLNHSRGQAGAMEALAERYTEETGIKVTIDTPGPADYRAKLQALSQGDAMPDTYYGLGDTDMAPYYKAGWAMDLTAELEAGWQDNFAPIVLDLLRWEEGNQFGVPAGVYRAPWEVSAYALIANPALFSEAGVDITQPPATTGELLDALLQLKKADIGPFQVAAEFIPTLLRHQASNWLTDEEIDATFRGSASWKADGWRQAVQLFADMGEAGVLFNDALSSPNPEVEQSFFNIQELACFYSGTFSVGVQRATAPSFTDYVTFPFPKADDGKLDPRTPGGPAKSGVVNPRGPNADEALKFIKWMTEPEQERTLLEMVPLVPANPAALEGIEIAPDLAGFASLVDQIQKVPAPVLSEVNEAFIKGVQSLLLGEASVDDVLDAAEQAQERG